MGGKVLGGLAEKVRGGDLSEGGERVREAWRGNCKCPFEQQVRFIHLCEGGYEGHRSILRMS